MTRLLTAFFAIVFSGACLGQMNVGSITQQGAKKMSVEELQQLHAGGVKYIGALPSGAKYSQDHKADGTVAGSITNEKGTTELIGKWTVDGEGRLCVAAHIVALKSNLNTCTHIWKLEDRYFASVTTAPEAPVSTKQFVK